MRTHFDLSTDNVALGIAVEFDDASSFQCHQIDLV
jgi:hypothetical protein